MKKNSEEREKEGRTARGKKKRTALRRSFLGVSAAALLAFNFGCQANRQIMNSAPAAPTPMPSAATRQNSVEQEIRDMETVGFKYVFVVRRKDGAAFDAEDRKYLRQNTPPETNRFVSIDDGRAFVIGTAFQIPPENIDSLKKRFNLEDFSKPEAEETPAANANAGQTNQANRAPNAARPEAAGEAPANR